MRSSKRKPSGSSKSETTLTVLQLHHTELLCDGCPQHLAQAHTMQQHRAPSPAALLFPSPATLIPIPASVFLVINGAIAAESVNNYFIITSVYADGFVYHLFTLVLSFAGAVADILNLNAVAGAVVVVVTAVAVVTLLLFNAF